MRARIVEQPVLAQRLEDRRALRRRLGGEFADRLFAVRELVGGESRERVVEGVRARRTGKGEAAKEGEDRERERGHALTNGGMQSDLMRRGLDKSPSAQGARGRGGLRVQMVSRRTCRFSH